MVDELEYRIVPATEVVISSQVHADSLRSARFGIPQGEFHAPLFMLEKRENHCGMGYHCHIRMRKGGSYERAGYLITMFNGRIFVTEHGGRALFNIDKNRNALAQEIAEYAKEYLGRVPQNTLLPITSDSVLLV